jgi:hypothetical protein
MAGQNKLFKLNRFSLIFHTLCYCPDHPVDIQTAFLMAQDLLLNDIKIAIGQRCLLKKGLLLFWL